jgi:hypothetical protein
MDGAFNRVAHAMDRGGSQRRPRIAVNRLTRAHFAGAIQRLKEERRNRVFIDIDIDCDASLPASRHRRRI